jgi:hypothetical protein
MTAKRVMTIAMKSLFDYMEEAKWPEVRRDRPPSLSASGRAAYHRRWEREFLDIAQHWVGGDEGALNHYLRLSNKHRNAALKNERMERK